MSGSCKVLYLMRDNIHAAYASTGINWRFLRICSKYQNLINWPICLFYRMFEANSGTMLIEATTEFQDQMFIVLASDILTLETGTAIALLTISFMNIHDRLHPL